VIVALDVHYPDAGAVVGAVAFEAWDDARAAWSFVHRRAEVAPYEPGAFYKRELPCLLGLLQESGVQPRCLVVDGYVDLDGASRPGLGRHLFDALGGRVPVVGVAKSAFVGIGEECAVLRGDSQRPLFVTCAGIDLATARADVARMHGAHRIPTLLAAVDGLCRRG
jgi:deoxyribonuclease V